MPSLVLYGRRTGDLVHVRCPWDVELQTLRDCCSLVQREKYIYVSVHALGGIATNARTCAPRLRKILYPSHLCERQSQPDTLL